MHTSGLGLPQCLFHMPHIVHHMIMVMEECNERSNVFSNALVAVVVLEPLAVTDVEAEANVPLEKLQPKAGICPG